MAMKIYIRKPVAIQAVQFDPWHSASVPAELVHWDQENDPQDGSFGFIQTKAGVFKVFMGDWICKMGDCMWVVEKDMFDYLYMASVA